MNESQARKIVDSVVQTYDNIADHFDITRTKIWDEFRYFTPFLRKGQGFDFAQPFAQNYSSLELSKIEAQRVLDIGCGNGRSIQLFEGMDVEYLGVDSSQALINIASAKEFPGPIKPRFMTANALDLSGVPGKFDVVLLIAVLQHIPSELHDQAISQAASKMNPGGILMMTNWNMWQKKFLKMRLADYWQRLLQPNLERLGIPQKDFSWKDFLIRYQKGDNAPIFQRYHYALTPGYLNQILKKHGFKIIKNSYVSGFKKRHSLYAKNILTIAEFSK